MLFYIVWTEFRIHLNFHILTTRWDIVSAKKHPENIIYIIININLARGVGYLIFLNHVFSV